MRTLAKLLIANRGEIAVRIAATCRRMGIGTVAVFSDADEDALHVRACDEAVRIGGRSPRESYLDVAAIIAAARRTGADAVHPGYGFLAERPAAARAVVDAGLTWVGPGPEAIAAMGDKVAAKRRMAAAGVPVLPSVELGAEDDPAEAAEAIGYPLMVKAAAGGGGRGMRIVRRAAELPAAVGAARREALGAFADDRLFLEAYLERARHVEVQVLADDHGRTLHLFERDCSIQRRHQKVIEEAPSPGLHDEVRGELGRAAVTAAEAIGYTNAGTVEFLCWGTDGSADRFAFLEMNTRLQVEHPVTEAVTGLDLVRLQLLVAMGEPLAFAQEDVRQQGHAIEARVYAEDPANGYLPSSGRLHHVAFASGDGIRVDRGVAAGSPVPTFYDPLLAKVIAHGPTRPEAAARLARALERSVLSGVTTNIDLLVAVLRDDRFLAGHTTTHYLDERFATDADRRFPPPLDRARRAILALVLLDLHRLDRRGPDRHPVPAGFTNDPHARWRRQYRSADRILEVAYRRRRDGTVELWLDDRHQVGRAVDERTVELDGHRFGVVDAVSGLDHQVLLPDGTVVLSELPRFPARAAEEVGGATRAPMPGTVVDVLVAPSDAVAEGQPLVVLEAMKMEHRLTAPVAGRVVEVRVSARDQVDADAVLVIIEADADR